MPFAKHWAARLDDYVNALDFSPDGALLAAATAAESGNVHLLAAADGARRALPGHPGGACSLAWQPAAN
ncbi:MAG: WD40 repeat domain-containing protein, partial [Opitutaceae bacterium]|nr:WD40 repeat domain-containing protein [Opitutaceae bacterium]